MKQGSFRAVRHAFFLFLMLNSAAFFVFGDTNVVEYHAIILEKFNGDRTHEWSYGGTTYSYEYDWMLDASKFSTSSSSDTYPKQTYVEAWPIQLYGVNRNSEQDLRSFGIWGKFDRRGYNWVDIYPVKPGSESVGEGPEPFEIPIPGRLRSIDMWVWGSNLNYTLEAYFRDHTGVVHRIEMGSIHHTGWKNLSAQIPTSISQSQRILPHFAGLTFIKFRLWTLPLERVDNFYVYFNQFKIVTDAFESYYDGDDLGDPDKVREFWTQN